MPEEERREQVTRVGIYQSQRATGGTRGSRRKEAAFNGWHEPDESRGSSPESVSGLGCNSPGRLGPVVQFRRPTHPGSKASLAATIDESWRNDTCSEISRFSGGTTDFADYPCSRIESRHSRHSRRSRHSRIETTVVLRVDTSKGRA